MNTYEKHCTVWIRFNHMTYKLNGSTCGHVDCGRNLSSEYLACLLRFGFWRWRGVWVRKSDQVLEVVFPNAASWRTPQLAFPLQLPGHALQILVRQTVGAWEETLQHIVWDAALREGDHFLNQFPVFFVLFANFDLIIVIHRPHQFTRATTLSCHSFLRLIVAVFIQRSMQSWNPDFTFRNRFHRLSLLANKRFWPNQRPFRRSLFMFFNLRGFFS